MRVKTVPYDRTKPAPPRAQSTDQSSFDYPSRPGTSGGRSTAETVSSMTGSVASTVRPMGSRTRLLSISSRNSRRPASLDSNAYRERSSIAEDVSEGFDSWDTSAVDPHNRLMVLETSSPKRTRFLETIPASPTPSRSPSPGFPLDLAPPSRARRGRSHSPVPRAPRERTLTPQASESELHIHPLFRSDSPVPPAASPGTVVVAAPNAGQFITGKSVTRMRSGSLPPNSPSPLSRQGSYDSFRKTPSLYDDGLRPEEVGEERKMTPPIPEWVLNAGSKSSLGEYPNNGQMDSKKSP
ncbi:hypothetical protein GGR57DRAFT_448937 [Xylariaceae sp. FL1272]|nr:hypothetical protein GGR57DRAFT_448937 [Xylariaceae sp. FL1272]